MWYFSNKFLPSSSGRQVRTALVEVLEESRHLHWPTLRRRFLLSDTDILLYGLRLLEGIYQSICVHVHVDTREPPWFRSYLPWFLRESLISLRLTDLARHVDQQTAVFFFPSIEITNNYTKHFSVASGGSNSGSHACDASILLTELSTLLLKLESYIVFNLVHLRGYLKYE